MMGNMPPATSPWVDTEPLNVPLDPEPERAVGSTGAENLLPWWCWAREGLRASLGKSPRTGSASPSPWQTAALVLVPSVLLLLMERGHVVGPAIFHFHEWLAPWWISLALLWLGWWALSARKTHSLAAWWVVTTWASLPALLLVYVLQMGAVHFSGWWSESPWSWIFWGLYLGFTVWTIGAMLLVSVRWIGHRWRSLAFCVGAIAMIGVGMWQFQGGAWAPAPAPSAQGAPKRLHLSQQVFEGQQALWQRQREALAGQVDGQADVFGLVFAPYAGENVFRNESTMVVQLLEQRFGAKGRVLHLLNHAETAESHVWATPENLERAIAALGARMNHEEDVLVVYMTSHGARDHELAAQHWPLEVAPVGPQRLKALLDHAGIRHRVVAISACYAGGWIAPLADEDTLVMTAADAEHTSYGCGARSELTFFGRAVFHEQLRTTRSFSEAFERAVPVIAQREVEAGKSDGFSNPQIHVGQRIGLLLQGLAQRLDADEARSRP